MFQIPDGLKSFFKIFFKGININWFFYITQSEPY